jgi:hypothetical protein
VFSAVSPTSLLKHTTLAFWRTEKCYSRIGVGHETNRSRAEKLSDAAAGWVYHRALSHRL